MRLIVLKEVILPIKAIRHIFSDLLLNSGNEKNNLWNPGWTREDSDRLARRKQKIIRACVYSAKWHFPPSSGPLVASHLDLDISKGGDKTSAQSALTRKDVKINRDRIEMTISMRKIWQNYLKSQLPMRNKVLCKCTLDKDDLFRTLGTVLKWKRIVILRRDRWQNSRTKRYKN